jgi:hypothetical protein
MATVYRIETKEHKGLYGVKGVFMHCNNCDYGGSFLGSTPSHPAPISDPGINRPMHKDERCGFTDINQLFRWFSPKDVFAILQTGFVQVVRIEGACVTAVGERQCLFVPPRDYESKIREECYHVLYRPTIQKLASVFLQNENVLSRVPAL